MARMNGKPSRQLRFELRTMFEIIAVLAFILTAICTFGLIDSLTFVSVVNDKGFFMRNTQPTLGGGPPQETPVVFLASLHGSAHMLSLEIIIAVVFIGVLHLGIGLLIGRHLQRGDETSGISMGCGDRPT